MLPRRDIMVGAAAAALGAALPMPAFAGKKQEDENIIDPTKARIVRVAKETIPFRIHVRPDEFALYWTMEDGRAIRYPCGVARRDLWEPGTYVIKAKKEWPSWTPTPEMIERDARYEQWAEGMPGGPSNPLGARALYLFNPGGGDTFLRLHGTNRPNTIGTRVSNGCARLTNGYIAHLYDRVPLDTVVHLHRMTT